MNEVKFNEVKLHNLRRYLFQIPSNTIFNLEVAPPNLVSS